MIVVATDGSEAALAACRVAVELASATGDTIVFVTAWRELRGDFGLPLGAVVPDVVEIESDWAKETAEAAVALAAKAGVNAQAEPRHGKAAHEVLAAAREHGARMIVVGSHGWGKLGGALVGSVASGILRHPPCPVLVVGEGKDSPAASDSEPGE